MPLVELDITRRRPYEDGRSFGPAGPYERLDGLARFAVDPDAPENAAITDLRLAPRDGDGCVRFEADFCVLRPERPSRRLLFSVANRGRQALVPFSMPTVPPALEVTERIEPGDGFLLARGWAVAWCGWQWDVRRGPGLLGLAAPEARLPKDDRDGQVLVQFQPHVAQAHHELGHWPLDPPPGPDRRGQGHRPYRPLDPNDPTSVLTVRERPHGPATELPRASWRFARAEGDAVVPDDTCVWLAGGFQAGRVYELRYRPRECPVVGAGLLAVRDFVSRLRHDPDGAAGPVDLAIAFGVSQSGRFLRDLLHAGLNVDGEGRRVFDGVMPHVAGARRGEFNQRFGQPSVQHAPSLGHLPPFHDAALLAQRRAPGGRPRVISTNTSSEYWRSQASLTHTAANGADLAPPAGERVYLFAGCQHTAGVPALARVPALSPWVRPANPLNTVDYTPLLRAALVNLERWLADGTEPPPSAVPRVADGTAVPREAVLARFAGLEGAVLPDAGALPELRRLDLGGRTAEGVIRLPAVEGEPYPSLVSSVDETGNEEAGLRLPDLTAPLAAHTGWNPRLPESGAAGQLVDMFGSTVPRPREAIVARYPDRAAYQAEVRRAAERMVGDRHLLPEDVDAVVRRAGLAYDALTAGR